MLPFTIKSNTARSEESWNEIFYGTFSAKTFPKNTVKSSLCSHVWSIGLDREITSQPGIHWNVVSFGIFKPGPLGTSIRGTSRYVASPSYSAPLVLWRGKGTTGRGMQQFMPSQCAVPTAGASRQSSTQRNTELSRLPMGTRGKQHSCKHSSLWDHRNYTGRDAAAASSPLPSSSLSCPFYLNSLCKVISVDQRVWPSALCVLGKCPAFSACYQIRSLTINHKNLDPSALTAPSSTPALIHSICSAAHAAARLGSMQGSCSLAHAMNCSLCINEPHKAIAWKSPAVSK